MVSKVNAGAERYNDRNSDGSVKQTSKIDKRKVAKRVAIGAAVVGGTILAIANRKKLKAAAQNLKHQILAEKALAKVNTNEKLPKKVTPPPIPKNEKTGVAQKLYGDNPDVKRLEKLGVETPFSSKKEAGSSTPKLVFKQEVPRTEIPKKDTRSFEQRIKEGNFKFRQVEALRSDGKVDHINVPADKKRYAKAFAESMAISDGSDKNYNYWYDYMMKKLDSYGP